MDSTFSPDDLARGDEQLAQLEKQLSELGRDVSHDPRPLRNRTNPIGFQGVPLSPRVWTLRSFTGLLLVACIGVAAVAWRHSSDNDAAKAAPPQPASLAQATPEQATPGAAVSPELTQSLQPTAREATLGQEIERLKASQEQLGRDNANVAEQLKISQQTAHDIADVIGQFKANQEQMARDIADVAGQLKASQEQMAKVSEQMASKTSASRPRQTAAPGPKPVLTQPSPHPQPKKPQVSTPPRQLAPVH